MKKLLILLTATAGLTLIAPAASNAQFAVEVPGVGVRIGEPGYRDYDRPRYREREYDRDRWERRRWRDREVRGEGCRTITIQRDDGSMRRIRRCG